MLGKLARRLGFRQSIPVALVEGWHLPTPTVVPVELAPRGGHGSCLVDEFGRIQIADEGWLLEFTLAAGARWVPTSDSERRTQVMVPPGVLETTITTPSGPVVERVAAGVVGAEPAAVVDFENRGGVAIALGVVLRPLRIDGRGHVSACRVDDSGIEIDGRRVVRFESPPASVASSDGVTGDLLARLPEPDDPTDSASVRCRSGAAQAAAVWPLPHTASVRLVVELGGPVVADAPVPSTDDINRGWTTHLAQGLRVDVDGMPLQEQLQTAARTVLTSWPTAADAPAAVLAAAELGFGRDAGRFFDLLDRCDDDAAVLRALARWAQLGEQGHQLDDLERILGRLARAAHEVDARGGRLAGASWLGDALVTLGGRLHQIDQPDVAVRIQGLLADLAHSEHAADRLAELAAEQDHRGVWAGTPMRSAAAFARALRLVVAHDTGTELALLPEVPVAWRGRPIDVFDLPVATGTISFGLRWHGARPALLWEASLAPDAPLHIHTPGIDPDFATSDRQGEALLADPGWPSR